MHGFDLYTWRVEYGTSALTSSFEELDSNLATSLFAKAVDLRSGQRRVLGKNREMLNIPAAQNLHVGQERAQSHPYLLATNSLSDFPIGQEKNGNRFAPITQLGHYGKETGIAAPLYRSFNFGMICCDISWLDHESCQGRRACFDIHTFTAKY